MRRLSFLPLLVAAATFPAFAAVDTALLGLLPPGAKVVSGIDFERARSSELGQFITARMSANSSDQGLQQFINETGFDPRHDVQQIVFATTGPAENGAPSKFAVLARSTFDQDRIKATAKTQGIVSQPYEGIDLFVEKPQHNGPNAFAFLGEGVGIMGDPETVKQIIADRNTPTVLDPDLQAAVYKAGTDNDAWFVSFVSGGFLAHHLSAHINGDQPNHEAQAPLPQAQALQGVLQSSGGIQFGTTLRISFDALTRSPQDATSLADVVRFFASMVQMERQKDPRAAIVASAFDNMNLATEGDAMHFSLSMPEKSLEQLVESMPAGSAAHPHSQAGHPHAQ
jgi:hypothetical protein